MISDLKLIKKEIYEQDLILPLLETIGCDCIELRNNRYEASRPNGNNTRSVQVYVNENLTSRVRSKPFLPNDMDIFGLVSYLVNGKTSTEEIKNDIPNAKTFIINALNLHGYSTYNYDFRKGVDPNKWLKELRRQRIKRNVLDEYEPNPMIDEIYLRQFRPIPHQTWIDEGIKWETQREFEVGYDPYTNRITFPIRNKDGFLVGVKGRTLDKEEEEAGRKYLPLYQCSTSKELYNLYRALPYIKDKNEVIVFEAEKSCMFAHQYGVKNTVAIMNSSISDVQAALLRRISPDLKIILAYDKGITRREIREAGLVFERYFNLWAIYDYENILNGTKSSPVDEGYEKFKYLYDHNCYKLDY